MQNLIVLGIIPGTNLQITFTLWMWLLAVVATLASSGAFRAAGQALRYTALICRAAWAISGGTVRTEWLSLRRPLA